LAGRNLEGDGGEKPYNPRRSGNLILKAIQGQSQNTSGKAATFAAVLDIYMQIASRILAKPRYRRQLFHCIDLNAGCGINIPDRDSPYLLVPSATLVFIDRAQLYLPDKWKLTCYELDGDHASTLRFHLHQLLRKTQQRVTVLHEDNRRFRLDALNRGLQAEDFGCVILDPNVNYRNRETNEGRPPVIALKRFFDHFRRIDLIGNLNISWNKRVMGQNRNCPGKFPNLLSLPRLQEICQKQYGLVSNITTRSQGHGYQFLRFILSNMQTDGWRAKGLYPLDSPEGKAICDSAFKLKEDQL